MLGSMGRGPRRPIGCGSFRPGSREDRLSPPGLGRRGVGEIGRNCWTKNRQNNYCDSYLGPARYSLYRYIGSSQGWGGHGEIKKKSMAKHGEMVTSWSGAYLGQEAEGPEHAGEEAGLGPGLPGAVHRHLHTGSVSGSSSSSVGVHGQGLGWGPCPLGCLGYHLGRGGSVDASLWSLSDGQCPWVGQSQSGSWSVPSHGPWGDHGGPTDWRGWAAGGS